MRVRKHETKIAVLSMAQDAKRGSSIQSISRMLRQLHYTDSEETNPFAMPESAGA